MASGLTARKIAALRDEQYAKPAGAPRLKVRDHRLPGLHVVFTRTAEPTWYLTKRIGGTVKHIRLGTSSELSIDTAKAAAEAVIGDVAAGRPVTTAQPAQRRTVLATGSATLEDLLQHCERTIWSPSRVRQPERPRQEIERACYSIMDVPAIAVDYQQAVELLAQVAAVAGQTQSNRVRGKLQRVWNEGLKLGAVTANPWGLCERFPERARLRRVEPDEMATYLPAVLADQHEDMRDVVQLILLTGLRKGNVHGMERSWINGNVVSIPAGSMKMGRPHQLTLPRQAMPTVKRRLAAGKSRWLFPMVSDPSKHIFDQGPYHRGVQERVGISPRLTFHDLRRTTASWLADLGVEERDIQQVLAHGSASTTTRRYTRLSMAVAAKHLQAVADAMWQAGGVQ